ncbi:MAG: hypothetical protein QOE39_2298 [Bradyrhizobium sp.]|jgi:hypothetical protein|nr:hypothetical protein [Bradyrhizobium sp.]
MQPMIPRPKKVEPTAQQQPMSYYESNAQRPSEGMAFPPPVGARIDAGLRAYMQRVCGYMAGGLALTGIRRRRFRFLPGHRRDAADLDRYAGTARLCPGAELRHPSG